MRFSLSIFFQLLTLLQLSLVSTASADLFRYLDASGKPHYVDSLAKVPSEFRATVRTSQSMPSVSKVPSRKYQDVEGTNYPVDTGKRGKSVEIYVTSWCPYCRRLEKFLKENNIRYTRYDVEKDPTGESLYNSLGRGGVPIIKIGSEIRRGFDEGSLRAALGL